MTVNELHITPNTATVEYDYDVYITARVDVRGWRRVVNYYRPRLETEEYHYRGTMTREEAVLRVLETTKVFPCHAVLVEHRADGAHLVQRVVTDPVLRGCYTL